jgi:hypothetical protein
MVRTIVLLSLIALGCRKADRTEWIDPAKLQAGPVRHALLTDSQMERVRRLQQTFADVDPSPLGKWVDDFKRDVNPERELRIYEGMADAYRAYCDGRKLSSQAKSDVYQVVLLRSGAPDAEVLPRLKLSELSVSDAKNVLALYKVPPQPITATPELHAAPSP